MVCGSLFPPPQNVLTCAIQYFALGFRSPGCWDDLSAGGKMSLGGYLCSVVCSALSGHVQWERLPPAQLSLGAAPGGLEDGSRRTEVFPGERSPSWASALVVPLCFSPSCPWRCRGPITAGWWSHRWGPERASLQAVLRLTGVGGCAPQGPNRGFGLCPCV